MEIRVTIELGEKTLGILGKLFNMNQVLIEQSAEPIKPAPEVTVEWVGGKPAEPAEPVAAPTQPVTPTQPTAPVAPTQPTGVPTAPAASYTLEDIIKAAVPLNDGGKKAELQALLTEFGVPALPMLPKERYTEFAIRLRALGAAI